MRLGLIKEGRDLRFEIGFEFAWEGMLVQLKYWSEMSVVV